jgi:hypothetical protein
MDHRCNGPCIMTQRRRVRPPVNLSGLDLLTASLAVDVRKRAFYFANTTLNVVPKGTTEPPGGF